MRVKVANRIYQMDKKRYQGLLRLAKEQIPFGIYAIEKNGYAELCRIRCKSITQLKNEIRRFKAAGYKVYQNGRD